MSCQLKRVIFACLDFVWYFQCLFRLVRLVVEPVFFSPYFLDSCGTPPWWLSYKETRTSKTYLPRYLTKEWNFRKEIRFGNLVVLPRWLYGSVVLGTRWNLLDTAMPELVSDDDLVSTVFVKGAQVKLCDLSKRPELNGKCGTLTQALAEDRWVTVMEGSEP